MLPLTINHQMLSKAIREKKRKLLTEPPEMVGTSPVSDMNAQDIYDVEQAGRIEGTLESPEKINADLTNIDQMQVYHGVGVPPMDMERMDRLRKYLDGMEMWAPGEKNMMRG
jgi:hypothetical protein